MSTGIIESMISRPFPTRAEVVDITNAVVDNADCVLLSPETAVGSFSAEATAMTSRICYEVE